MGTIETDAVIDAKGLNCPAPVIKTKQALDKLNSGQVLGVYATDPIARYNITALIKKMGHELLEINDVNGVLEFFIKK